MYNFNKKDQVWVKLSLKKNYNKKDTFNGVFWRYFNFKHNLLKFLQHYTFLDINKAFD